MGKMNKHKKSPAAKKVANIEKNGTNGTANGKVAKKQKQKKNKPKPVAEKEEKRPTGAEEEPVPSKKASKADANTIAAGTTIDQVSGLNLKPKKSIREKKRQGHAARTEETKRQLHQKEWDGIREYLNNWKNDRKRWKFQKRLQLNIQEHVFDEGKLNDDVWPIAVEYLSSTKGESRKYLISKAKEVISAGDADEALQTGVKYERARELLQSLG